MAIAADGDVRLRPVFADAAAQMAGARGRSPWLYERFDVP
jgi:hypothetical protein